MDDHDRSVVRVHPGRTALHRWIAPDFLRVNALYFGEGRLPILQISAKQQVKGDLFVGSFVDEDFKVASGIRSTLREIIPDFNFGVVQVLPTGSGAEINAVVAHEGNAFAAGLDISKLI